MGVEGAEGHWTPAGSAAPAAPGRGAGGQEGSRGSSGTFSFRLPFATCSVAKAWGRWSMNPWSHLGLGKTFLRPLKPQALPRSNPEPRSLSSRVGITRGRDPTGGNNLSIESLQALRPGQEMLGPGGRGLVAAPGRAGGWRVGRRLLWHRWWAGGCWRHRDALSILEQLGPVGISLIPSLQSSEMPKTCAKGREMAELASSQAWLGEALSAKEEPAAQDGRQGPFGLVPGLAEGQESIEEEEEEEEW